LVAGEYDEQLFVRSSFLLDGIHRVRIQARREASLREGDLVAVSGSSRSFGLNALAFANLTTGRTDNAGVWESLLGGVLFAGFSASLEAGHLTALVAVVAGWLFFRSARIALAAYDLRCYLQARQSTGPAEAKSSDA